MEAPEDVDDLPDGELEDLEEEVVDQASAAKTIAELGYEIETLRGSNGSPTRCAGRAPTPSGRASPSCSRTANAEMFDETGERRKLIVFSEHRDTLNYLTNRIRSLIGRPEAVVEIHGGMHRELRREAQESFRQDPDVFVLVATDAAGEGVNLQQRAPARQLRPAVESEPDRAALRADSPHRPDRGLPHVEPGRLRDPRGPGVPAAAREARRTVEGARRARVRRARRRDLRRTRCATF